MLIAEVYITDDSKGLIAELYITDQSENADSGDIRYRSVKEGL